jgi:hypothetical protein
MIENTQFYIVPYTVYQEFQAGHAAAESLSTLATSCPIERRSNVDVD